MDESQDSSHRLSQQAETGSSSGLVLGLNVGRANRFDPSFEGSSASGSVGSGRSKGGTQAGQSSPSRMRDDASADSEGSHVPDRLLMSEGEAAGANDAAREMARNGRHLGVDAVLNPSQEYSRSGEIGKMYAGGPDGMILS